MKLKKFKAMIAAVLTIVLALSMSFAAIAGETEEESSIRAVEVDKESITFNYETKKVQIPLKRRTDSDDGGVSIPM